MYTASHTVRPDAKGRITLGKLAEGVSSYRVYQEKDGCLRLEPYTEIPARERWLYENPEALASVLKGIEQAEAGKRRYRGSFAHHLHDDDV